MITLRLLLWLALRVSWARNATQMRHASRLILRACEHLVVFLHREDLAVLEQSMARLQGRTSCCVPPATDN